MKFARHFISILILTIITQIGGIVYLVVLGLTKKEMPKRRLKRLGVFVALYLISTFLIVPSVAPFFGRERITNSQYVQAQSWGYILTNRNYVRPELNETLLTIAKELNNTHKGIRLVYLDANFPFLNQWPLLPHLSHNDGKKIDLSLIYELPNGRITNKKPSISGYGAFEGPKGNEYDQTKVCKSKGKWQYDFPKYLTLGTIHKDLKLSEKGTRDLIRSIIKQPLIGKLFLEPHLKDRLHLTSSKIRFHGCQAVRHDDHIHVQLH